MFLPPNPQPRINPQKTLLTLMAVPLLIRSPPPVAVPVRVHPWFRYNSELWPDWLHFPFFFSKYKKMYARFSLLNSYCKIAPFRVFGAQTKMFDFWLKLLHFLFFFSKNKKMYAKFSLLNSYCKIALFRVFGAQTIF